MKKTWKLFVALLVLLFPLTALADEDFTEDVSKYTFSYLPPGTITCTMPVYEKSGYDSWVYEGYVYAEIEGGKKVKVLSWRTGQTDISNSAKTVSVKLSYCLDGEGKCFYKRRDGNLYTLDYSESTFECQIIPSTDNFDVTVEWTVPYSYRGKRVKMSYESHIDFNTILYKKVNLGGIPTKQFDLQAAPVLIQPQVMPPFLAYDKGHTGHLMVPWIMSAPQVTSVKAYWHNNATNQDEVDVIDPATSGYAYVDAFTPMSQFKIGAEYRNSENVPVSEQVSNPPINIPMLHAPKDLVSSVNSEGHIVLKWKVNYPGHEDIMDGDYFEVQRNLSGNNDPTDKNWSSVGMVDYHQGESEFEYVDGEYVTSYQNRPISYRVRRASVSTWGWVTNAGYVTATIPKVFSLPSITKATITKNVEWGKNNTYAAQLNFTFGSAKTEFLSHDLDGTRLCFLRTAKDWENMAKYVAAGEYIKAYMLEDVNLGNSQTMVGTVEKPFRGIFHGCGHTLTVNYNGSSINTAPFSCVQDAEISNLRVKGTCASTSKFSGGLVGYITGIVNISNVHVSTTVSSSVQGDATNGGIVGHTEVGSRLTITDCLFDGVMAGSNSYNNGGIVGWVEGESQTTLTRVTFAPQDIETSRSGCQTFARCRNWPCLEVDNCLYTRVYGGISHGIGDVESTKHVAYLRNASDWEDMASAVKAGNEVIAYMQNDIDLGDSQTKIGTQKEPFWGKFYGQWHVLRVNYNSDSENTAPFSVVLNAEIRDLRVAGNITSKKKYSAGIVGMLLPGGTTTIERCLSSVNITGDLSGAASNGGILSHSLGKLTVSKCNFHGSLLGSKCNKNSGIVGCVESGDAVLDRCVFNPESIQTDNVGCQTYCRRENTSSMTIRDCKCSVEYNDKTFFVSDAAGFASLNQAILQGKTINVYLMKDIDLGSQQSMLGSLDYPFKGVFNGLGHTLKYAYSGTSSQTFQAMAPIAYAWDAHICNLHVTGSITDSGEVAGGIVGLANYNPLPSNPPATISITNCIVSTDIKKISDRGFVTGGFIGTCHGGVVRFSDCLFDGSLSGLNSSSSGGFLGYGTRNTSFDASKCLFAPVEVSDIYGCGTFFGGDVEDYSFSRCCYTQRLSGGADLGMNMSNSSLEEIVSFLGWGLSDSGKALPPMSSTLSSSDILMPWIDTTERSYPITPPVMEKVTLELPVYTVWDPRSRVVLTINKYAGDELKYTERRVLTEEERLAGKANVELNTSCVEFQFDLSVEQGDSKLPGANTFAVKKTETGDAASYEHDNRGIITSAKAEPQQTSVHLSWETDGGDIDFYRILRQDKAAPAGTPADTLVADYLQNVYIDKTAKPQHVYAYTIEGVTQCESVKTTSYTLDGQCFTTGAVKGYVRLPDGTALANHTVVATPTDGIIGGMEKTSVTDETGFFLIEGLVYQGEGSYSLIVSSKGNEKPFKPILVTFDDDIGGNEQSNVVFYQESYYTLTGKVLYEGSSIPVGGVNFLCDGILVTNANGDPITTNAQGAYSLSMAQGTHQIQAVKDGHVFMNEGYFLDPDASGGDPRSHDWVHNIYDYLFWDQTKVTLQGRVVGGNDQGLLPLGQSLSKNNLGDELTITMQLEGDNASYIVRDQLDSNVKERDLTCTHGKGDITQVHMTRRTITIHPDPNTGEYALPLYPVKYKVTEVYATGYSTLFQAGMVGETIDLTNYQQGDTATYSRIFHNPATLRYEQVNLRPDETYFGLKSYTALDVAGAKEQVSLWDKDKGYSLGYPVFMANSSVALSFSAREEYYYNNVKDQAPDVVRLNGGVVKMQNGLISSTDTHEVKLDSVGEGSYVFTPKNSTFMQENDAALRTLTLTLLYDSTYYDITPLKGYVMASQAVSKGRRVVNDGGAYLIDILRDPPGGGSSAYLEAGSKFSYTFNCDVKAEAGIALDFSKGSGSNFYQGLVAGVTEAGTIGSTSTLLTFSLPLTVSYYNSWNYNYNFETTERIQTSTSPKSVGADADVYIGMTQNSVVEDAVAVRVVPAEQYQRLKPRTPGKVTINGYTYDVKDGLVKVLARGVDAKGDSVYLIRDEVLQTYMQIKSTFAHSQTHILKEIIPTLLTARSSLMLPKGTTIDYARDAADRQGHPFYISKVDESDPTYTGRDANGQLTYTQVNPTNTTWAWNDSIQAINNKILMWAGFIAQNEKEKLEATDLVKSYDFDGRTSIQYSENFAVGLTEGRYMNYPGSSFNGPELALLKLPLIDGGTGVVSKETKEDEDGNNVTEVEFLAAGVSFKMKIKPVASVNFTHKFGGSESQSKKIGFTLSMDNVSNLLVDVYRTRIDLDELKKQAEAGNLDIFPVLSQDYIDAVKNGKYLAAGGSFSYFEYDTPQYSGLVYRTRGGATTSPWEDQRVTQLYNPGTVLDVRTQDIDRPHIWAKQSTVSNVPHDQPARFTIYLENDSEVPSRAAPHRFNLMLQDYMNPKGAKILIDGNPLPGEGHYVFIPVGTVVEKQVEVYAGEDFDYDDLGIALLNSSDPARVYVQKLSAHFIPVASPVHISLPGNKWVMNTESSFDKGEQDYYLPVRIDGFNVNSRGFDHIELQYKLATQSDKDWVNVCSYYKSDSLMALASGTKQLIVNDGYIDDARFFGENSPVEQTYDVRAVCYCRHAGGYLTRASEVLTGIKDTRRPRPFGTPTPANGILGIGDDIIIAFSEQIAGNYLRDVNNFEVLGTTNSSNIALSTSLRFNAFGTVSTLASRNLIGKDFTIDLMLNPDNNGKAMNFFTHGGYEEGLTLGLTSDRRLKVEIRDKVMLSEKAIPFNGLRQVAVVFDTDLEKQVTDITFYDGTQSIGTVRYDDIYRGSGALHFGRGSIASEDGNFEGNMLEARLWNMALSPSQLATYSQKRLTGYELGLLDNFPMNEGTGEYCYNKSISGADGVIFGPTWYVPDGLSMKLDGEKGFRLDPLHFQRENFEDYTMMFWFRTYDWTGTIFANGMSTDEAGYKNHFRFHLNDGILKMNLSGMEVNSNMEVNDGQWHHVAVTVNRSRNVGNLYIDKGLKQTFMVDTLGGISGNRLAAGAVYIDSQTAVDAIHGHIDEIAMYEMVLPENMLIEYSGTQPTGEELGLMAYLSFGRDETQLDNMQRLMPTGISLRRYRDQNTGKVIATRNDTIVEKDVVERLADRAVFAPMRNANKLENIAYSYVAEGKNLFINLDVPEKNIEKTNVYLTVKDVADLQGNLMASPVCLDLYVYRTPLRWDQKRLAMNLHYGEEGVFEVTVKNLSGKRQEYKIEGIPLWITASQTRGTLDALDEEVITLTVSPYINIGDYDEVLYLVGTDEMAEPLPLNIHVRGDEPDWVVSDILKGSGISMHIVARVEVDGQVAHDTADRLAVYGDNHQLLGVTYIDVDNVNNANDGLAYLTIYNMRNVATPLRFEYFDASTGRIFVVRPTTGTPTFKANQILGTASEPLQLVGTDEVVQTLELKKGWNWISFNVEPETATVSYLLNNATQWEPEDGLEVIMANGVPNLITYKEMSDGTYAWDKGDQPITLDPHLMYRFYSQNDKKGYLTGKDEALPLITVKHGWNRIGYISGTNLPLATALADYIDAGSKGDIIKSQSEFAMLTEDVHGNKSWKGTLKFLRIGEGYMLKRNADTEHTFLYPNYQNGTRYKSSKAKARSLDNRSGTSMTMVAVADGVTVEPGDVLMAWRGAELVGVAEADENGLFWLNIGDAEMAASTALSFTISRDDEVVATADGQYSYKVNAALGTVDMPTSIRFVDSTLFESDGWYTLGGIKLTKRPTARGVYIYNNEKVIVK